MPRCRHTVNLLMENTGPGDPLFLRLTSALCCFHDSDLTCVASSSSENREIILVTPCNTEAKSALAYPLLHDTNQRYLWFVLVLAEGGSRMCALTVLLRLYRTGASQTVLG